MESTSKLSAIDYVEIQNVINLYPYIVDVPENYGRVGEVFAEDAVFSAPGIGDLRGVQEMTEYWSHSPVRKKMLEESKLLAHNSTNHVITQDRDGTVRCLSRALVISKDGRAFVAVCNDIMRKTPQGWRIAERKVSQMTGPTVTER